MASIAKTPKPPARPAPTLTRLTAREVGALLGVSYVTVYAMAKRGHLPAVPVGLKGWRFFKEPILAWRDEHLAASAERTSRPATEVA